MLGGTLGPVLDYLHVVTGAIRYTPPARFVPWWVPLLYTGASLVIGLSHPLVDPLLRRSAPAPVSRARLGAGFLAFVAIWFASGALPFGSLTTAMILTPLSLALWGWLDGTAAGLAQAAATAMGGVAVEVTLGRLGLFAHAHQDVLGVALWLPAIYIAASVAMGNLGRALVNPHQMRTRAPGAR